MKIPLIQIDEQNIEIRTRCVDHTQKIQKTDDWSSWTPYEFDARYPSLGAMLLLSLTVKSDLAMLNPKQSQVTISARCADHDGNTIRTVEYQARFCDTQTKPMKERIEQINSLTDAQVERILRNEMRDTLEIIYTWPNGREEVRYRRPDGTDDAKRLMDEVDAMKSRLESMGEECPYSYRLREVRLPRDG